VPDDDGGSPISHYVVEKQEDDGRWVEVGQPQDCNMKVGKLREGHQYKFRVKAVNKQGESQPLTTTDAITAKDPYEKPGKPEDLQIADWDKDRVDLQWKPPVNDGGAPIEKWAFVCIFCEVISFRYIIEKKDKFGDWVEAMQVSGTDTVASVPNLTPGETYQFRVKAVNKAGPGEPTAASEPVTCRPRRRMLLQTNTLFIISQSRQKSAPVHSPTFA
jgi:predicted phage tail protein